ncbi:MAG: tyrosine-protein phosphatase [Spirochaetota bacterium]
MQHITQTIKEAEQWLAQPLLKDLEKSLTFANSLVQSLQEISKERKDLNPQIGPLLGKIKSLQKKLNSMQWLDWLAIRNGWLSIGHRPGKKLVEDLKLQNTSHILTLLAETEGALEVKKFAKQHKIHWLWFPMPSAEPLAGERKQELFALFADIEKILVQSGKLYIHCSAGIHRTGMISYAFLRFLDFSKEKALSKLQQLRLETATNVGKHRVDWGDSLF